MMVLKVSTLVALLSGLYVASSAQAVEGHQPCPRGKDLLGSLTSKYDVVMEFQRSLPLTEGLTFIDNGMKAWREYWGTYLIATISHGPGENLIPAGTLIRINPEYVHQGHMATRNESLADIIVDPVSSQILLISSGEDGHYFSITINSQPYSKMAVGRVEKLLGVTFWCKKISNE
jgi:VanZ family protein